MNQSSITSYLYKFSNQSIPFNISLFGIMIFLTRKYYNSPKTPHTRNMSNKTVIVTGSNTGIGKTAAIDFLEKGANVIFACRDETKTKPIVDSLNKKFPSKAIYSHLNLGSFQSIRAFNNSLNPILSNFGVEKIDILVNNAGGTFDKFNLLDNIESTIMVNHVGPVYLTSLLMEDNKFNNESRIINVASRGHNFVDEKLLKYMYKNSEDNFAGMNRNFQHMLLYCLTKAGNIYHALSLAEYYNNDSLNSPMVKTGSLHPGLVNTEIFNSGRFSVFYKKLLALIYQPFLWLTSKDCYIGAQTTLHIAYMDYDELNSGAYFEDCKMVKVPKLNSDREKMIEFMVYTKKMIEKNAGHEGELPRYLRSFG